MHTRRVTPKEVAQLSAYIDGQLSAKDEAILQTRLDSDDALFEAYTELLLVKESLHALPTPTPPRSLRIDVAQLEAARGWRWWFISPPGGRALPAMSMLASIAVCVVLVQTLIQTPNMAADALPLKGSSIQLSEEVRSTGDNLASAPESAAAPALSDTLPQEAPLSAGTETFGATNDDALTVDLTQFVLMAGVVVAALAGVISIRWLWQVRPARR